MTELKIMDPSDLKNSIEDQFIVPYHQNPRFTGHKIFLQMLKEKLYAQAPKQYNHRIALYGMGDPSRRFRVLV